MGPTAFGRLTNAEGPHVAASSICSSSGIPGPAGVPLAAPGAFTRSPIAVTAASAGSGSGSRRKPLTLVVARSLTEALLTVKQAVANRQAFVTATRHSSSRTHAVFQLRWRSPATPATGGGVASTAAGPAGRVSGGGAAQRAYSAPPRASLSTGPAVCPALAASAGGRAPAGGAAAGPVCTLTLVDTCSFCPLLPPKEGSAVKRSLLALSRVLSGLQRRHALTLRESKLTRMLEGAVDQVLVLACLGGSGDEPTVQLVKMLQQGVPRDNALRRSRRASSSDSTRESGTWEPHTSVFSVSAVRLGSGGADGTPPLPRANATAAKCTMGGTAAGPRLGPVPGRSIFRSPGSPAPGCNIENKARPAPTVRTDCPAQDSVEARGVGADGDETAGGGSSNTSSGGGTGTDADALPAPQLFSSSLEVSSTSPAASSRSADDCGVEAAAAAATAAALPSAKAARPAPVTINVHTDSADALATADVCSDAPGFHVISDGGGAVASAAAAAAAHEKRLALSSGGGNTGGRRAGSSIPSPPGSAAGTPLPCRMSPRLFSPRQKPPSVTARAAPSPEVRRSQGFSILAGKWASPPPASPRDRSLPVLPCILTPRDGASASATSSQRSVEPPAPAATSTGSAGSLAASERLPRGSVGARPTSRAPSAPLPSDPVARSPASKPNRGGRDADAKTPRSGGCAGAAGAGVGGFISPFAIAEHQPEGPAVVTSSVDPPEQTCAGPSASPAPIGSTLARRKPSIPGRPPVRSPQPSPFAAAVAAAAGSASPRSGARSPSPSAAATVVSLAAVRPTRLASMRYGSANISHDSAPDGSAGPAAAAGSAVPPVSPVRMPLRRGQSSAVAAPTASVSPGGTGDPDGSAVRRAREAPGGTLAALKRSVSSGLRWPSPLLRARRVEWLSDLRRSRSAFPRPVSDVPEPEGGNGASPRRLRHGGFRCAVMGRPTLSAQYKDLLLDFEAFKARERPPRKHRSALGDAAPPMPSAATAPLPSTTAMAAIGTLGTVSPERLGAREAKAATAAPDLLAPGLPPKQGSPMPARSGGAASALATVPSSPRPGTPATSAPPGSPVVSTGLAGASSTPTSISTPHSARPASGSCARPPSAFSRAHSPSAEEGLISLTAAAAVAAASPRTPASGSALPSGRPRPGVSRAAGTAASPRPLRSPENATTTVSPVTVLDMSRLFATKGSPSAAAAGTTAPGSGRSRLSASSVNAAAAGGPLTSGGSDRYRRLAEEDADSDIASAAGPDAESGPGSVRIHSDADPSVGSDSDQDNLLGPGCLGHLGLMLDTGGDVAALRNSLNLLTDSGRASPAIGAVAAAATPSPLRRVAVADAEDAVASAGAEALYSWPSEGGVEGPDEELPAVSFFICQFTPRPEFRDGDGDRAAAEEHRPSAAAGEAPCAATISADADAVPPPAGTEATAHNDTPHAKKDAAEMVGVPQTEPLPEPEQQQEELTQPRQRRSPMRQAAAGICASAVAAAAAAAVAELQLPYTSQDRASVESGVLRGSCTPFAVDSEVTAAPGGHAAAPPTVAVQPEPGGQEREPEAEPRAEEQGLGHRNRAPGSRGAAGPQETTEGTALGPPSESSISLRQLLERQELLLLQQRLTRRPGGLGAAVPAAVAPAGQKEQGQGQRRPGGSGGVSAATLAANARLAQLARVRPNHSDLDEQSNVLVDVDSTSESEVAAAVDAARRTVMSLAQQCGRPSAPAGSPAAAVLVNGGRPLRPSAAPPEPPAAVRTPSPIKPSPSASPSQLPAQSSSVRSRVAAFEAAISPVAARTSASSTPPHLMQSWAHGGGVGGHRSPAAATSAAGAQGGSADGARRGLAQARSSPSPGVVPSIKPTADKERKALSGSSPVPQRRAVPANGGAGHARHPSDGAIGAGGVLAALRWGTMGRTAAAAPAVASPPPSPPPRLTRSTDSQGAARLRTSPSLSSPPPPPPLAQQSQQRHYQQQPAAQQQQPLRGSGNVAAAWRAAAAMSTSSSSSVRSCFRSSSGQPQQNSMIGSDATAVATVVALGHAPPSSCDDKHDAALAGNSRRSAATAAAAAVKLSGGVERSNSTCNSGSNTAAVKLSGGVERSNSTRNSGSNAAAVKLSGGVERSNSTRNSGSNTGAVKLSGGVERSNSTRNSASTTASATAAAAKLCGSMERSQSTRSSGSTIAAAAAPVALAAAAITPPLPPNASAAPNTVATRSAPPGSTTVPYVPPLALPPQPTATADAGRAAPPSSTLAKAKSARSERSFPLTARLRSCKSHRTPRAAGSSAVAGEAAGAGLEEVAEQPPPPAYPPGFVTWATRLFSGSRKKKQQPF